MHPFRIGFRISRQIAVAVLIALLLLRPTASEGITITVMNSNDSGSGSLRDAIGSAGSGDIIMFDTILTGDTIILTSGEIIINKNLVIIGLDDDSTFISGNHVSRIFAITAGDTVSIEDMTLTEGMSPDSGGAVYSNGDLSLKTCVLNNNSSKFGGAVYSSPSGRFNSSGCVFQNNSSIEGGGGIACMGGCTFNSDIIIGNSGGRGGGIYAQASLFITGSTISGNNASGDGGGILNYGNGRAVQCLIENNTVNNPASAGGGIFTNSGSFQILTSRIQGNSSGAGGGVRNEGNLTIATTTISNNNAAGSGGGIGNEDELTINNSTLSGNISGSNGGAAVNSGELTINGCTLSGNRANSGGGIQNTGKTTLFRCTVAFNKASSSGGGVNNADTLHFSNTIIANDTANGQGDELYNSSGKIISQGHNLVRDISPLSGADLTPAASDKFGTSSIPVDPLLGPLQNNGGTMLTHEPQCGSPAIDSGDPAGALSTDQRDSARIHGNGIDIGSVESQYDPIIIDAAIVHPVGSNNNGSIELLLSGGTAPYYVHWNNGDSVLIITGLSAGNYTVTVEDFYGCSATEAFSLTAVQPPVAAFTWENPSGGTVNFTNTSSNNPTTFHWNFDDGDTSIAQNPSHTYSSNGSYYVCLSVANASGTDTFCDSVSVTGITSIEETGKEALLLVYPNPGTDYLYIEIPEATFAQVFDACGKLLQTASLENISSSGAAKISIEELPGGIYLLLLHDGRKVAGKSRFSVVR